MGTAQSVVSELEQGNTDPRLSALQSYARAIGCRLDLALVEDVNDESGEAWQPRIHFKTWRNNKTLRHNHEIQPVQVEKPPNNFLGVKLEIAADGGHRWEEQQWRAPTHSRHTLVKNIDVTPEPDEFLLAVSRG